MYERGSAHISTISHGLQWRVSLLRKDPHALPSMQRGELDRDRHVGRGHVSCGLCVALVVRWLVAVSAASASGDDSVV